MNQRQAERSLSGGVVERAPYASAEFIARFEGKFIPEPNSGCWLWLAACLRDRYGREAYGVIGRPGGGSRTILAHRAAWLIYRGNIPVGLDLLHSCDNKLCVNPDHLKPGTRAENNADMARKGRACSGARRSDVNLRWHSDPENRARFLLSRPFGRDVPSAKLTEEDVRYIRSSAASQRSLARKFGVSRSTIKHAKLGATWTHVK